MSEAQRNCAMVALSEAVLQLHEKSLIHGRITLERVLTKKGKVLLNIPYFHSIKKAQRRKRMWCSKDEHNIYTAP